MKNIRDYDKGKLQSSINFESTINDLKKGFKLYNYY